MNKRLLFPIIEELSSEFGPQHIEHIKGDTLVVVSEDFQWEFIPADKVLEINDAGEEMQVIWEGENEEKNCSYGAIKYLKV